MVEANSFVRLKVKVEFRKDLVASDLPSQSEALNLSFTVKYTQSDDNSSNVSIDNNGKLIKIVSGDGTKTSDELCIGEECFYVISSTEDEIKMLSKYNLLVGNRYDATNGSVALENPTGIQDEIAKGWFDGYNVENPMIGTTPYSRTSYWDNAVSAYPAYVYNENSYLYEYVENYKSYLEGFEIEVNEARLITIEELEGLGCVRASNRCSGAPSWIYLTSYWTMDADSSTNVWSVYSSTYFGNNHFAYFGNGVRPVIVISRDLI